MFATKARIRIALLAVVALPGVGALGFTRGHVAGVPSYAVKDRLSSRPHDSIGADAGGPTVDTTSTQVPYVSPETKLGRLQAAVRSDATTAMHMLIPICRMWPGMEDGDAYDLAVEVARRCRGAGIDPLLVLALIQTESGGDRYAKSATNDHGLMQLHARPIYSVRENVMVGIEHLATCFRNNKTDRGALAEYNGGPNPPPRSYDYADRILRMVGRAFWDE